MNYFKGNITGSRVELLSIQNASTNWIPFHKYTSKNNSSTKSAYIASSNTFCHFVKVYIYIFMYIYILSTFLALHACIQLQWSHWMLDASIWLEYGPSDASTLKMKDFSLPEFIRVCFVLGKKLGCPAESYVWLLKVTLLTSRFKTTSLPSLVPLMRSYFPPDLSRNSYLVGEGRKLIRNTKYHGTAKMPQRNWLEGEGCWGWGHLAIAVFQIHPRWHKNASRPQVEAETNPSSTRNMLRLKLQAVATRRCLFLKGWR